MKKTAEQEKKKTEKKTNLFATVDQKKVKYLEKKGFLCFCTTQTQRASSFDKTQRTTTVKDDATFIVVVLVLIAVNFFVFDRWKIK